MRKEDMNRWLTRMKRKMRIKRRIRMKRRKSKRGW
jgi:hypothetical protein